MDSFNKTNLQNIKDIFEKKTDVIFLLLQNGAGYCSFANTLFEHNRFCG